MHYIRFPGYCGKYHKVMKSSLGMITHRQNFHPLGVQVKAAWSFVSLDSEITACSVVCIYCCTGKILGLLTELGGSRYHEYRQ